MAEKLRCKIVIFEDDQSVLTMLSDFFKERGAEVITFSDGDNALENIISSKPDIVLMDVVMPIEDGYSIVSNLRKGSHQVPVILLTEKNSIGDKVYGLDSGADDYLCKPFSLKELFSRVKAQLRRIPNNTFIENSVLKFKHLTINSKTREVHIGKHFVPLTKTEFDLLCYLANKAPEVTSHVELYKNVLGYHPEAETKALVMHVMNLKRKLSKFNIDAIEIKAVPGVGYKVSVDKVD